jgi:hypothetical protein
MSVFSHIWCYMELLELVYASEDSYISSNFLSEPIVCVCLNWWRVKTQTADALSHAWRKTADIWLRSSIDATYRCQPYFAVDTIRSFAILMTSRCHLRKKHIRQIRFLRGLSYLKGMHVTNYRTALSSHMVPDWGRWNEFLARENPEYIVTCSGFRDE